MFVILNFNEIIYHQPVDEAMPERLPQARLTMTVESCGLLPKINIRIRKLKQLMHKLRKRRQLPLQLPVRSHSIVN